MFSPFSHSLSFLMFSCLRVACQHPGCQDHQSCPICQISFSSYFLSNIPITTHIFAFGLTLPPLLCAFFSFLPSLAMFPFFHFEPEGKWAVTSVAGTRTSPVARTEPAPVQEAAKSLSQGRAFTSSKQFLSAEKLKRVKTNLDID